jgi:hypothetical protein
MVKPMLPARIEFVFNVFWKLPEGYTAASVILAAFSGQ